MAKYIIVGGVAGGATAAARLRRLDEHAEIIIMERGQYISYANCGLPYYLGGVIKDRDRLFVQTNEEFAKRFRVDVRVQNEVLSIRRDDKKVRVQRLLTGEEYDEAYDKLILSPGAEPLRPPIPGINDLSIFTLRNVMDTDRIKDYLDKNKVGRVVIIGAGFIGLEMAENMHHRGIFVTIVEMSDQVMTPLDYEMAAEVHQHLKTKNIEFYLKDGVSSFVRADDKLQVRLNSGKLLDADLVILSIGVKPDSHFAGDAGLELGEKNGIVVNEYLQTKDPDIYAVGDAITFMNPVLGKPMITYLAGPANKQGRIVADNIVNGNKKKYAGSIVTAIAKVFDITVASTGLSEKVLKAEGIPYISSIIHGTSHAGYYPNALPLTIKIVFSPTDGKLYGAQIIGYEGVDKRIDLCASVIQHNETIYDLQALEHAYAPPYSSAKDPVNIAGFAAENILVGLVKIIHWDEIADLDPKNSYLLDVRTIDEFKIRTIENAVNIPLDDLRNRMSEIPKDKKIIVFCSMGQRGYVAARILIQHGYNDVYNLTGGCKTYEHASGKQSNEDIFEKDVIGKDDYIYQLDPEKLKIPAKVLEVDACGLQCPGPILRIKKEMEKINFGDHLRISASDPGFKNDVGSWCNMTGNKLLELTTEKGMTIAIIEKKDSAGSSVIHKAGNDKTIIVFSDDMDKALASMVIANGAASTGKKVTMFFTFWGLNVIKRRQKPVVKKDFMGKMFSMMMPENSLHLALSKMNMLGLGPIMMRMRMKMKNVDALETMIQEALDGGVEMIACQMSMDIMGVDASELMDGVHIGGVATYLEAAEQSSLNLFI